jgi:HSP20 family protein
MSVLKQREQSKQLAQTPAETFVTPVADIESSADGYILRAEMPGVNKGGIEVTVENGDLTIVGRRAPTEASGALVYRESRGANFRRVYELDPSIDTERITARIDQGVLTVTLPKAESVKPRRISLD